MIQKAAFIQVRLDSSRFPKKALSIISDKPLLWHLINRSKKIGIPIIVITTTRDVDDPIADIAMECNVDCFRGSYEDVLDRFYQAAKKYSLEKIFRITADSPLIDPRICKKLVSLLDNEEIEYIRLVDYPIGIGMEGFTFNALSRAWKEAKLPQEREHVTIYFKNPQNKFKIFEIKSDRQLGKFHWTVEQEKDMEYVREIFEFFKDKEIFHMDDILDLINKKPSLLDFNSLEN